MARAKRVASLPLLVYWLSHDCCYQLIPMRCQAIGNPEGSVRPHSPLDRLGQAGSSRLSNGEGLGAGGALLGVSGCWVLGAEGQASAPESFA